MSDAQDIDLLTGHEEIAAHLGWTVRQTKHRDGLGELPTFRLGAGRTVYARKSTLAKHFAEQERSSRSGHSAHGERSGHSTHGEPSGHSTLARDE